MLYLSQQLEMDFKTTSYFFPSNCHRMKKNKIDSSILLAYRKQIKTHLSCFVTSSQSMPSRPSTKIAIKQRRYTAMSAGKMEAGKQKKQGVLKQQQVQKLSGHSLSIFKLLHNAKKLHEEQLKMQDNPFYKIQKKRLLKAHMKPKISDVMKHKTSLLDQGLSLHSQESQQQESKLFHNQSLSKLVAQEAKTRTKSQTVTYYEIKSYYEEKYGHRLSELSEIQDKQRTK